VLSYSKYEPPEHPLYEVAGVTVFAAAQFLKLDAKASAVATRLASVAGGFHPEQQHGDIKCVPNLDGWTHSFAVWVVLWVKKQKPRRTFVLRGF
jgi:hypothetical protein